MRQTKLSAARRILAAKEEARQLALRADASERLSDEEALALTEDLAALAVEYPDVFPELQEDIEPLRASAQRMKDADEEVRKARAGLEASARALAESEAAYVAALEKTHHARLKGQKAN